MSVSTIVEKVQKLLALSKSSNMNEAMAAAAAANKLIDQYRLSTADLEAETEVKEPIEEDEGYIYESGKVTAWKYSLMMILKEHYGLHLWNDCHWNTGRQVSRYRLIGRKSDITIAKYMFSWLTAEATRLSTALGKGMGRVYIASWCQGFVAGIKEQLKLSRGEAEKGASANAIVHINARSAEAQAFLKALRPKLVSKSAPVHSQIHGGAFREGERHGKSIHLGSHLGAGGTKLLGK